jgi:hypothetical protein
MQLDTVYTISRSFLLRAESTDSATVYGTSVTHIKTTKSRLRVHPEPSHPSLLHSILAFPYLYPEPAFRSFFFLSSLCYRSIEMRPPDPTLPSIAFVLSQAQTAASTPRNSKRRGKFGIRRTKSSPSMPPHPPRNPPRLDNEFLKVNRIASHPTPPSLFCTTFSSPFPLRTLKRALPIFLPQTDRENPASFFVTHARRR